MIDRARFEEYDRALGANAALLDRAVGEFVAACDHLSGYALKSAILQAYQAVVDRYGSRVAMLACDLYEDVRGQAGELPGYHATTCEPSQEGLLRWDVSHALASSDVAASLSASARQRTMAYADETIAQNARRDPAHPCWAIVPHVGACGWCVMLGSNGFQYRSEGSTLASRHPHCTCPVVVDFDTGNPTLEGYDPGAMRRAYQACRETVEADAQAKWDRMGPEERKRYSRNGKSPSYDAYLRNRVAAEMNSRDREWLRTGKVPEIRVETGARPNPSEWGTARKAAAAGYAVIFRKTRDLEMLRTSDAFFESGSGLAPWDFKGPDGNGSQTIYHQLEEAAGQTRNVLIDLAKAGGRYDDAGYAIERASKFIRYTYGVKSGRDKGKKWRFDEVAILAKDGSLYKITR